MNTTSPLFRAVTVLSDTEIAYLPGAFAPRSRGVLAGRYPAAVIASAEDAAVLGLNAVSDGRHVVLPSAAGCLTVWPVFRGALHVAGRVP